MRGSSKAENAADKQNHPNIVNSSELSFDGIRAQGEIEKENHEHKRYASERQIEEDPSLIDLLTHS